MGRPMSHCIPGDRYQRVIPHRHTNPCTSGTPDTCPGCVPCPQPHCHVCHRNHTDDPTCPTCLSMARDHLRTIRHLTANLHDETTQGRHALHIHEGIPGGDALVMLAPGNYWHVHTPEETTDPRPPLVVLAFWAEQHRQLLHQYTDLPATHDRVHDYLDRELHRMATLATFPTFFRDLAATRRALEDVLHDGTRPETTRVPCWECGTRLVKQYANQAADDHWFCPRCGEKYDRGRYDRAKHDHLASTGAARYVLLTDAVAAIGRPVRTVRTWVNTGRVQARRDPSGRLTVWWPDVRNAHLTTGIRPGARKQA